MRAEALRCEVGVVNCLRGCPRVRLSKCLQIPKLAKNQHNLHVCSIGSTEEPGKESEERQSGPMNQSGQSVCAAHGLNSLLAMLCQTSYSSCCCCCCSCCSCC